jgi:hypothetical protein
MHQSAQNAKCLFIGHLPEGQSLGTQIKQGTYVEQQGSNNKGQPLAIPDLRIVSGIKSEYISSTFSRDDGINTHSEYAFKTLKRFSCPIPELSVKNS